MIGRILAAAGVSLVLGLVVPGAALAASPPDPTRTAVSIWFAHDALDLVLDSEAETGSGSFAEVTGISAPLELWTWTAEFIAGSPTDEPVEPTGEWIAAILSDDEPLGVITAAYDRERDHVEFTSYSDEHKLASGLLLVPAGATLVTDPPSSTWVTITGDTVTALDADALAELPEPASVADY